jgi:hypothetical protein
VKDAKKYIARNMGIATSSIPSSITPPDVIEDTCPLCGKFMPLDKSGYCGTDECRTEARRTARKIARAEGGNVSGLYYKFGDLEVVNMSKLEQWEPPKQVKHPDMCSSGECTDWARPADHLCKHHRLAENREEMLARNAARRAGDKKRQPRRNRKGKKMHGNKIRGLDKIKL